MRQARWPAFFIPISSWNKGVSGGEGFGDWRSKNSWLTAEAKSGSKLISESQISCDMLFLVNSGHARYPDMLTWIIHVRCSG